MANAQTIVVARICGHRGAISPCCVPRRVIWRLSACAENTLARRAVAIRRFAGWPTNDRPLIYSISADPVAAAKGSQRLCQDQRQAGAEGGFLRWQGARQGWRTSLASIPSREELLAKLLGVMQAPVPALPVCWLRSRRNVKKKPQPEQSVSANSLQN